MLVLVKYSEIAIKGKKQSSFEHQLIRNIQASAKLQKSNLIKVYRQRNRIICDFEDNEENIHKTLEPVFGIKYYAFAKELKKDIEIFKQEVKKVLKNYKKEEVENIAFKTKRGDKQFPLNSVEINSEFGSIATDLGIKVDYKNAKHVIFLEIPADKDFAYLYQKQFKGAEGLPVGSAGRVLCLLSGGIDSPVAAQEMMKRGCIVDFIHFHSLKDNEKVKDSKIAEMIKVLNKFQFKSTLYAVPYSQYELNTFGQINPRYELVFFKYYIVQLAQKLAEKNEYLGVVTGDAIAQVASQTLENLRAVSLNQIMPIYRPLLTWEKEDIISKAQKIGTLELSHQEYKDCCSIHAKNPLTCARIDKFKAILESFEFEKLLEESLESITTIKIQT
ncbi:MAG: tRNA uracil 4-sulfurtransferase ThiI [Nanoarchaeota archaeon]